MHTVVECIYGKYYEEQLFREYWILLCCVSELEHF